MDLIQQLIQRALPDGFDPSRYFISILVAIVSILILGGIFRLCFGKGSVINGAFSSAIAILCLYVINVVVYSFGSNLQILFAPLPFVEIGDGCLNIYPIFEADFTHICQQITSMLILSYLMNLLEHWLPKGNKIWSWYSFRALSLLLAICLNYCVNMFLNSVLPTGVWDRAPMILLGVLAAAFCLGVLKLLIGGALAFINPFLGLFYTFFFSKVAGKQLLRAIITTLLLTLLVCAMNHYGFTSIVIASVSILTYLPVIILGLLLWYVLAKLL